MKVTLQEDFIIAEALATEPVLIDDEENRVSTTVGPGEQEQEIMSSPGAPRMRVGSGFDVHRLVENRPLILGGVTIPHPRGLDGHSDADALLHALCDAILGAMAAGDIGTHFPNTDPRWKDCDSAVFVKEAMRIAAEQGYGLANADILIMAEAPKMNPHLPAMREKISAMLGIPGDRVGLKAGTMETMGFIGREEGIGVQATVLLERNAKAKKKATA
jgi:2-C-methyl-D-erythritol 2,4-cyclodiphosphate synthase